MEIYVDDEAKLTLHGLVQHYILLNEDEKNRKLNDLLDALDFNQVNKDSGETIVASDTTKDFLCAVQALGTAHRLWLSVSL